MRNIAPAIDSLILRAAFAATIRRLRKRVGIAQEDLALKANIERAYMSALECKKNTPSLETIFKLITSLEITFPEFCHEFHREILRALKEKRHRNRLQKKKEANSAAV